MVSAMIKQEFAIDYDVSYRESESHGTGRDVSSKDRFQTRARYGRRGKAASSFSGTHRRRNKRNYL